MVTLLLLRWLYTAVTPLDFWQVHFQMHHDVRSGSGKPLAPAQQLAAPSTHIRTDRSEEIMGHTISGARLMLPNKHTHSKDCSSVHPPMGSRPDPCPGAGTVRRDFALSDSLNQDRWSLDGGRDDRRMTVCPRNTSLARGCCLISPTLLTRCPTW